MNTNAAVVFDVAELSEAIHEEADARPRGADHLGKSLLGDRRKQRLRLARTAKIRQEQERPRQAPFAGIEELIDEIRLGSDASGQNELHEKVGEGVFLVQDAKHPVSFDLERDAAGYGHSRGRSHRPRFRDRFLAKEIPGGKHRYRGFFAPLGDDGELCPAILEVKHRVGRASLEKESLLGRVVLDDASRPFGRQKKSEIKGLFGLTGH